MCLCMCVCVCERERQREVVRVILCLGVFRSCVSPPFFLFRLCCIHIQVCVFEYILCVFLLAQVCVCVYVCLSARVLCVFICVCVHTYQCVCRSSRGDSPCPLTPTGEGCLTSLYLNPPPLPPFISYSLPLTLSALLNISLCYTPLPTGEALGSRMDEEVITTITYCIKILNFDIFE